MMKALPENATELRKSLNKLARILYSFEGHVVEPEMDFQNSTHPQERRMG